MVQKYLQVVGFSAVARRQGDLVFHEGVRGQHRARREGRCLRREPRRDGRRQGHRDVLALRAPHGQKQLLLFHLLLLDRSVAGLLFCWELN